MTIEAPLIEVKNSHDSTFNLRLSELVAHFNQHGTLKVSPLENEVLANWINTQRSKKKRGQIHKPREIALNTIGFDWSPQVISWDDHFDMLVAVKKKHGTANIPVRFTENPSLGDWVRCQRLYYWANKLSATHKSKLDSLGFWWTIPEYLCHVGIEERAEYERSQQIAA